MAVAPDGSELREFYKTHDDLGRPQWLPDGSAIIVPVREGNLGERGQFCRADFPSAQAHGISNDHREYSTMRFEFNREATALAAEKQQLANDHYLLPDRQ